jgi:hypothetical protein
MPLAVSSLSHSQRVTEETDPTWSQTISVWWLIAWRGLALGFLIELLLNLVLNNKEILTGPEYIVTVACSIWLVWMALRKQYRGFRIAILSRGQQGEIDRHDEAKSIVGEAMAVWWLIAWRGWVGYMLLIFVFVLLTVGYDAHKDSQTATLAMGFLTSMLICLGVAWQILTVRMALLKRYSWFRIAIVPPGPYHKKISAIYE